MNKNRFGGFARVVRRKVFGDEEKNAGNDPMIQQLLRNETTVK